MARRSDYDVADQIGGRSALLDALLDVGRTLADPELDDADVRETVDAERILGGDGFDFLSAAADRQDDAAVAGDLPARGEEMP